MWAFRMFLVLLIISIIVGFSMLNAQQVVSVDLLRARYNSVPLVYVTYWAFLAGMLVTFVLGLSYVIKIQGELREERKEKKRLVMEITALRNRSIEEIDEL
jgi:uncharacterized integral membrane protein